MSAQTWRHSSARRAPEDEDEFGPQIGKIAPRAAEASTASGKQRRGRRRKGGEEWRVESAGQLEMANHVGRRRPAIGSQQSTGSNLNGNKFEHRPQVELRLAASKRASERAMTQQHHWRDQASARPRTRIRTKTNRPLVGAGGRQLLVAICLLAAASAWAPEQLLARGQLGAAAQVTTTSSPVGCPYPPVGPNCQVNIVAQAPAVPLLNTDFVADEYAALKQDTQASYKCDRGFELLGSETATCLASGRWSSAPPSCVTNVALGKPANQSSSVKGGEARNANDGQPKLCTETKVDQSPWLQLDLVQLYEVRSIRILGRPCCNPQLGLHDIEIRVGNSSTLQGNRLCAWYPNNLDEGVSRDFLCAHPIVGRFVSIQMVGIEAALSLCEVMVFSTKEFPAERCSIQSTLKPQPASSVTTTTTTSATTTQQTAGASLDNQLIVFNNTCYETQATNGGSFLVADTYCKARGGSLLHSVTELTHSFISQELERMKNKLKSKLVWLGAKRENASPNALGPITPGSTSAFVGSDSVHQPSISGRSLSSSLHEFPLESLFSSDHGHISSGESSSIFSPPTIKLTRSALLQASSGSGGATSRGSQTFGLQTSGHHHHPSNRTIEHPGRSLIVSQPSQIASYFTPPVSISSSPTTAPAIILQPQPASPPASPVINFSPGTHTHRSLRPPSLASTQPPRLASSEVSTSSRLDQTSLVATSASSPQGSSQGAWRWVGDSASETLMSPITSFMWADDQPNNYNNQQDCIVLDGAKRWLWNDVTCELDYLPWVCQYRPSTCGSPDHQENSTILEVPASLEDGGAEKSFNLGKVVTYACPVGHKLEGPRTRKCLYDGTWSGRAPKCQYVNCGPIGAQLTIENGRAVYLNQSQTTFGSQVKYVCYEDYVLVGDDTRQCQADGKWAGKQPYCAYKFCPQLQQISNGQLNVTGYTENSIASYQCNSGHKLIGNDTRQCLLGGKWTNQEPFCQYVDCGQPKPIANGAHQLVNGTTNYLSLVQYTCNENYTLVGNSNKMICSHNNRWSGREPQCSLIDCGQPQVNLGSRLLGDSFAVHSTVEYRCEPGFKEVSGSTQRTCGLDGQWTGQPLSCKYVDCGRVPGILKGEVSYINGTTYLASQVSYECTSGNRIAGSRIRFCGPDGRWTSSSPKCEEVRCEAPELPANGSAIYIGNDRSFKEQSFSVGVTVRYECDYGHVVKGSWASRLCQASGEWSGEPPVCKFVDCGPPPSIDNGNYLLKHPPAGSTSGAVGFATPVELSRRSDNAPAPATFTYYGTIAHYSCEPNYKLQGPAQRECLESGRWRTPLPSCEPIQCPKPEFFDEHTVVSLIPKALTAELATQLTSGEHQVLNQLAAVKSAGAVRLIANSQWLAPHDSNSLTFAVGDKLHFACTPGYESYGGPEIRTCTQYGQWSGSSTPRCRQIDCGRPAPIGQEGRFFLLNESTTFNSLVEYSCVRPFKLIEVKVRQAGNLIETLSQAQAGVTPILTALPVGVKVCANNGQWMPNDQQPKCTTGGMPADSANGGQFDGVDNTLDGSNRVPVLANGANQPTFIGANQDGDSLDLAAANGRQQTAGSQSSSLWAKIVVAICLLVMLALIILTLICIRSGKKPKQAVQRTSILTSSGQAAAAAAAMQLQMAGSKAQIVPPNSVAAHHHQHLHQAGGHQAPLMAGQSVYINGMSKMYPAGAMVGQSQMSSGNHLAGDHSHAIYGEAAGSQVQNASASNMVALSGQEMVMNGKSSSLGILNANALRGARQKGFNEHQSAMSGAPMMDYSRLSIDSEHQHAAMAANKNIRHNPNGLVTFVSPAQQQHQQQHKANGPAPSSASSGVSSTSHQHQISPHSISTSLSVSASSSPSSHTSSSSHHHTTNTRLSGTDSTGSASSINQQHHRHQAAMRKDQLGHMAHQQQQQSEYQAPQQFLRQEGAAPEQAAPPSLPAHPPPPHRVQQHHKQLMKHQASKPARQQQQVVGRMSSDLSEHQASSGAGYHYMEPSV